MFEKLLQSKEGMRLDGGPGAGLGLCRHMRQPVKIARGCDGPQEGWASGAGDLQANEGPRGVNCE